jgi:purine-binding chemotaxis protein CheW
MTTDSNAYLTFLLGKEKFAIKVDYVQEIVELGQVTLVPKAPEYMLGIINLRGRVLPLLDTNLKLGLQRTVATNKSRIMVLDIRTAGDNSYQIGAMVDVASEVVEINTADILPAPEIENADASASPITGIVNNHGQITMIMDIAKVFLVSDVIELNTSLN